jgi:hypothetical protein
MDRYDVCVVGGGSAGFGAALASARSGARTVLVEREETVGGTAVNAGVNMWEPGVGGTGVPTEIYRKLSEQPKAVGVYGYGRHFVWGDEFPGGEHVIRSDKSYADTLRRHGMRSLKEDREFALENLFGVVFEPVPYSKVMNYLLRETGRCDIVTARQVIGSETSENRISLVQTDDGPIEARYFIDCTGNGTVCASAGCRLVRGREGRDEYGEPSAPEKADGRLNGVTLVFRITPRKQENVDPLPEGVPEECWWADRFPKASFVQYPKGGYNVNILPLLSGEEYLAALDAGTAEAVYAECERRIRAFWYHVQSEYQEFRACEISHVFPRIGVREESRVVCRYMLREQDVTSGISENQPEDTIAIADHALDRHDQGGGAMELSEPFAIPYRSLVPEGPENLLVAGRAAGFTSIAASSCRLSRTMMQLGQAAGTAAAFAAAANLPVESVPARTLKDRLRSDGVTLEWPTEGFIARAVAHV